MIWYQLTYHDDEPEYGEFSIFDCRTHRDFFQHGGSEYFLRGIKILNEILKDGIRDGSFSENISFSIVNTMIFGLLDMENIQVFTGQRPGSVRDDFDAILDMVLSILVQDEKGIGGKPDKEKTISAAVEKVFAENGFEESTTIDIARTAVVAEGTLYEYFKNKDDILFSGLRNHFVHLNGVESTFAAANPIEKLSHFIKEYFILYLIDPFFMWNFISGGIYNKSFYQSPACKDFTTYMETIDAVLDEGKRDGFFRPDVNNRIFKNLFIGCVSGIMLRWFNSAPRTYFDTINAIDWRRCFFCGR